MQTLIAGQYVEVDHERKRVRMHIREFFRTAGKMYGWSGDPTGISINEALVNWAALRGYSIMVSATNEHLTNMFDAKKVKEFCELREAYYQAKQTRLCVVPWSGV